MDMTPGDLRRYIIDLAASIGFDCCGIARPEPIGRAEYLKNWLAAGHAGTMVYLQRNLASRVNPGNLLANAKSAIVVTLSYKQPARAPTGSDGPRGRVAMYAWGEDYHVVLQEKLDVMRERLQEAVRVPFEARICVDTAPIIERELAAAAGVGWIGKNTMVLNREIGSFFFLGVMLTTLEIAIDDPVSDHCGSCTACLDACPTLSFPAPYQMDASRCISYLTIEHRGDISRPFQDMMGDWLFGCDVCQDVCPFNRKAPDAREPRFIVRRSEPHPNLEEILNAANPDAVDRLRVGAMDRATPAMLRRNAEIAIRNASKRPKKTEPRP